MQCFVQTSIFTMQTVAANHVPPTKRVIVIPAKAFARDYGITGVHLSVCLSVTTITK